MSFWYSILSTTLIWKANCLDVAMSELWEGLRFHTMVLWDNIVYSDDAIVHPYGLNSNIPDSGCIPADSRTAGVLLFSTSDFRKFRHAISP